MTAFVYSTRKWKQVYSDRKQKSGCLRTGDRKARLQRGLRKLLRWWICSLSWLWWWFHRFIYMSKLTNLYTLNICSLLYASYTSIRLFRKRKKKGVIYLSQGNCDHLIFTEKCYYNFKVYDSYLNTNLKNFIVLLWGKSYTN